MATTSVRPRSGNRFDRGCHYNASSNNNKTIYNTSSNSNNNSNSNNSSIKAPRHVADEYLEKYSGGLGEQLFRERFPKKNELSRDPGDVDELLRSVKMVDAVDFLDVGARVLKGNQSQQQQQQQQQQLAVSTVALEEAGAREITTRAAAAATTTTTPPATTSARKTATKAKLPQKAAILASARHLEDEGFCPKHPSGDVIYQPSTSTAIGIGTAKAITATSSSSSAAAAAAAAGAASNLAATTSSLILALNTLKGEAWQGSPKRPSTGPFGDLNRELPDVSFFGSKNDFNISGSGRGFSTTAAAATTAPTSSAFAAAAPLSLPLSARSPSSSSLSAPPSSRVAVWPAPKTGTPLEFHESLLPWGDLQRSPIRAVGWQGRLIEGSPNTTSRSSGVGGTLRPGDGRPWPGELEGPAKVGHRGLLMRGTYFDFFVNDDAEPRRNGIYQFCVVGIDLSSPDFPRYHCWEPTGLFDRTFTCDEVEHHMAMARFHRISAHAPVAAKQAIRWSSAASRDSLVHGDKLPDLDSSGRPVLSPTCKFPLRHSVDALGPVLWTWKRRFDSDQYLGDAARILVLDHHGLLSKRISDEFPTAAVVAVDAADRVAQGTLRRHRNRCRYPINFDTGFRSATGTLHFTKDDYSVVFLPFVFRRFCNEDETLFFVLLSEALRVASKLVILALDLRGRTLRACDDILCQWKSTLQAKHRATMLADMPLSNAKFAESDFFLGQQEGSESSPEDVIIRRCLFIAPASKKLA